MKLDFRIVCLAISSPVLKYSDTVNYGLPKPSSISGYFNMAVSVYNATGNQKNKQHRGSDSWCEMESFAKKRTGPSQVPGRTDTPSSRTDTHSRERGEDLKVSEAEDNHTSGQ